MHQTDHAVSVLFSEPKIPQPTCVICASDRPRSFSALQRAENSSTQSGIVTVGDRPARFQCSSASRKFLNRGIPSRPSRRRRCFSALQRAENSSTGTAGWTRCSIPPFQCSSASRKFLNLLAVIARHQQAMFQCSSASRKFLNRAVGEDQRCVDEVSVLFSEPKIPQPTRRTLKQNALPSFQCSSASRKFLNLSSPPGAPTDQASFQCSSASRKFLNPSRVRGGGRAVAGFSALQRAENSSISPSY